MKNKCLHHDWLAITCTCDQLNCLNTFSIVLGLISAIAPWISPLKSWIFFLDGLHSIYTSPFSKENIVRQGQICIMIFVDSIRLSKIGLRITIVTPVLYGTCSVETKCCPCLQFQFQPRTITLILRGSVYHWWSWWLLRYFRKKMGQCCHQNKTLTRKWLVVDLLYFLWWHRNFPCPTCLMT